MVLTGRIPHELPFDFCRCGLPGVIVRRRGMFSVPDSLGIDKHGGGFAPGGMTHHEALAAICRPPGLP